MSQANRRGVVAAGSAETAAAGVEILSQGGNAVDAAVAAAFVTFIAETALSQTGGSGFALICQPGAPPILYDFFSTMPGLGSDGAIDRTRLDFQGVPVDFAATQVVFHVGRGSVAVPGNVAGLCALAADRGRLPLSTLLAPAIRLAREGVVVSPSQAYISKIIEPILNRTPGIAHLFSLNGRFIQAGDRLRNPALAATLESLVDEGPALFYNGEVAAAIVADQATYGGLITAEDLRRYQVVHRQPLRLSYRGVTILTNPPPSSGGALIAFSLRLLDEFEVGKLTQGSMAHLTLLAEVMRVTNQARATHDPARLTEPGDLEEFLSRAHLTPYRQRVAETLAAGCPAASLAREPRSRGSTTHISVLDGQGMAVSLTTTPGESAGFLVGDTGVIMNNLLGEDDLHPHGFHTLPTGVRLSSMMAPTILLNGETPWVVLGSGGSNRLRTAILQVISNIIDFNMPPVEAIHRPRMHFEGQVVELEGGFDPVTADGLEQAGYQVNRWPGRDMFFGGAHTVTIENGLFGGDGDSRRGGVLKRFTGDSL